MKSSPGAYEAGVYQALYERITKKDKERGIRDRPVLDIVAGTSIGSSSYKCFELSLRWAQGYPCRYRFLKQVPTSNELKLNLNILTSKCVRRKVDTDSIFIHSFYIIINE
jgi:hypothetical protein